MRGVFRLFARYCVTGLVALVGLTLVAGIGYPLLVGAAAAAVPGHATGRAIASDGREVGSALVGQDFSADPTLFHGRPSATGYRFVGTGPSNRVPGDPAWREDVRRRRAAFAAADGVPEGAVGADAVTASASGIDPDITPATANAQVTRVARANHLDRALVAALVKRDTQAPALGVVGMPRVNVVALNADLVAMREGRGEAR
ncbi:MAG: potassium-transporting ATPase subunit C [Actinomycetaceae bacterium]|nr:potassium-transporting ATPase subunit C [Actinomycetaceae bacterium]MDU0970381.1 potassium-transporting ATPase subunit C [Actinomycetaceae bacterium]